MSLRDELLDALNDQDLCSFGYIWPIIERALAAERAATIEECAVIGDKWAKQNREHKGYDAILQAAEYEAAAYAAEIRKLPGDRSALDFAKKMAAAEARHEMNQKIGEHLGQDANEKSTLQMLDDALAQAKREEGTASFVLGAEFGFRSGERGNNLEVTLADAAAILAPAAPAAPVRQRGEPARQRGEQED